MLRDTAHHRVSKETPCTRALPEKIRKSRSLWGWGVMEPVSEGACPSSITAKATEKTLSKSPPRLDFLLLLPLEIHVRKRAHTHTKADTFTLHTLSTQQSRKTILSGSRSILLRLATPYSESTTAQLVYTQAISLCLKT